MELGHLPRAPGIYAIVNTTNGKQYIGSSLDVLRRVRGHRSSLRGGRHWNVYLSRAFASVGESAFRVDVLATCEADALIAAEQWFIDRERAADREHGYNASPTAERPTHTAETRARISAAQIGRQISDKQKATLRAYCQTPEAKVKLARMQEARKGTKHSPETRARISETQRGRPGRKLTPEQIEALQSARRAKPIGDEARRKMSAAKKGKPGRKLQPHEIEAIRERNTARRGRPTGRVVSDETIAKMLATRRMRAAAKKNEVA